MVSLVEKISLMFTVLQIPTAIHKYAAATMQYNILIMIQKGETFSD